MRTALVFFLTGSCIVAHYTASSQLKTQYNLGELYANNKLSVYNRAVSVEKQDARDCIKLDEDFGEGLAWINDVTFSTGAIEIDLKGQDLFQHSFVGIAFHALDQETFDAIYFRPFQFRTLDSTRQAHAIQYVSLPVYTWQKLREEQNGKFENTVHPMPDPNDWFHAKIVIKENEVQVYVNDSSTPSLTAPILNKRKTGKVALYTADRSGGTFASLSIAKD